MVQARRAFLEEDDTLDITPSSSSAPRRGAVKPQRRLSKFIAPLALTGLVVAGTVALTKGGESQTTADPVVEVPALDVSRDLARKPLTSPSASASESGAPAPLPTPSATSAESEPAETPTAQETATETAEATPEPTNTFDPSALGNTTSEKYAASSVNVRTGPGTGYDVRVTLQAGAAVTLTDLVVDGWQQIVYKDAAGWVKSDYLSDSQPETAAPVEAAASCNNSSAASIESGLTAKAVSILRAVCAQFPDVQSYGGYRADSGYHGQGRAIDVMISGERGWEIATWLRNNASDLGVIEVIYSQKIWTTQRSSEGWRAMADRGSATANHYDHVHISVAG